MTNTVCTLFELVNGDDTEGEGACVRACMCVRVNVTVTTMGDQGLPYNE